MPLGSFKGAIDDTYFSCLFPDQGTGTSETGIDQKQLCPHRIAERLERPEDQRTFGRKDHLLQHLKQFHNHQRITKIPASCEMAIDNSERVYSCGFCGVSCVGWDLRARHIANHFRQGLTMDDWH